QVAYRGLLLALVACGVWLFDAAPAAALVNPVAAANVPAVVQSKPCSRAFRYAARVENDEVGADQQTPINIRRLMKAASSASFASLLQPEGGRPAFVGMCGAR